MIVDELGVAILPRNSPIRTGTAIFTKPAEPVLLLRRVPHTELHTMLVRGQVLDYADELSDGYRFFHDCR